MVAALKFGKCNLWRSHIYAETCRSNVCTVICTRYDQ